MKKSDKGLILGIMMLALMIVVIGTALFFTIYALMVYGNKPITEIPSWAFWLMGT